MISHHRTLEVKRLNQQFAEISRELSVKMGMGMSRIEQPPILELVTVFNAALEECYLCLHSSL